MPTVSPEMARLLPIFGPVTLAGVVAVIAALVALAIAAPSPGAAVGLLALLVAATLAEAFPVPLELEGIAAGGVSLAAVFVVGAAILYGWAPAVIMAFVVLSLAQVTQHRERVRLVYNSAVYALSGLAAAGAAAFVRYEDGVGSLLLAVFLASAAFYATNVVLIAAIVARAAGERLSALLRRSIQSTVIPFSIMASVSLMLAVLWERSPVLAAALVGPLVAIALYQRSVHEALRAMRLALTDPLTGLGNHRHFHERLQRDLDRAQMRATPLALCLIDIDNFKQINDGYGHPVGDRVLAQVASRLRQGGEAFRLGGDEFALLLPGRGERDALAIAEAVLERVAATDCEHGAPVTVSAGIASFPQHGLERSELVRVADSALYWSKEHGKGRVRVYRSDVVQLTELRRLATGADRSARYLAAAALARAVDARDAYTGVHSSEVGELAARIATRLGLDSDEIELIRLAGSLHDLGKLAIPEEILRKPGPLNDTERIVVERHPQIGFRMLDSLGIDPVASWVLHHHERWDGDGYPDRLSGERIPLGARILLVADAYDAMTTDRVYRGRLADEDAIRELERCAGTQFDPGVVAAFKAELGMARHEELIAV
jgi:diguanylate cyclase (GGDEF)-like protein